MALTAYFTMVALDDNNRPTKVPELELRTPEEEALFREREKFIWPTSVKGRLKSRRGCTAELGREVSLRKVEVVYVKKGINIWSFREDLLPGSISKWQGRRL